MRILALETSSKIARAAVLDDDRLLLEKVFDADRRSTQQITPGLKQILQEVSWKASDIDLIAVTTGPGSFTGLRIGLATAKTLAYATGAQLIGLNTLAVIAQQVPREIQSAVAVLDAQRRELFAAKFQRDENQQMAVTEETTIVPEEKLIAQLSSEVVITGPGVANIQSLLPAGTAVVDSACWQPTAETVGQMASRVYQAGQRDDLWQLVPQYYRKSAAEEQWEKLGR